MSGTIGFIFARGGSKGLPGKNVRELAGKPLITHSIETALKSPNIDRLFVSSEDSEIIEKAQKAGADIIVRPAELAQDDSPEWLAWQHAVRWVQNTYGDFDCFVSMPATSPLRNVQDISNSITRLKETGADVCISVTKASRSPYFNMVVNDGSLVKVVMESEGEVFRRQDAPEVFDITTVVYATTPSYILESNSLFDGNVTSIEVPKERSVDIDDIYDFKLAEVLFEEKIKC